MASLVAAIVVEPGVLTKVSQELQGYSATYRRQFAQFYSHVADSQAVWQGDDADAFRLRMEDLRLGFTNLAGALDAYSAFLSQAASAYTTTQNQLQQQAAKLPG